MSAKLPDRMLGMNWRTAVSTETSEVASEALKSYTGSKIYKHLRVSSLFEQSQLHANQTLEEDSFSINPALVKLFETDMIKG